jgi:hypothetical protein
MVAIIHRIKDFFIRRLVFLLIFKTRLLCFLAILIPSHHQQVSHLLPCQDSFDIFATAYHIITINNNSNPTQPNNTIEMSRNYSITEPHPSVPSTMYAGYGRGGAGNVAKVNPKNITNGANAEGPASLTKLRVAPANAYFAAGRGGAGNMHHEKERAMFSFDEELARQQKLMEHQAPYYHVGRGGAGNAVDELEKRRSSASSNESTRSAGSVRHSMEAGLNKIRGSLSRH